MNKLLQSLNMNTKKSVNITQQDIKSLKYTTSITTPVIFQNAEAEIINFLKLHAFILSLELNLCNLCYQKKTTTSH